MAALLLNAHNISATDKPREWGKINITEGGDIKTIDELFPAETTYTAVQNLDAVNVDRFKESLGETNIIGFSWLLKPEVCT